MTTLAPACVDCKHYFMIVNGDFHWCHHPDVWSEPQKDLVTGDVTRTTFQRAERCRADNGHCGPSGLHFEERERSWLGRLADRIARAAT